MDEKENADWIELGTDIRDADLSSLKADLVQKGLQEIESSRQAVARAHAENDKDQEAECLTELGKILQNLAQMKSALEAYTQALAIFHEQGNQNKEAYIHLILGRFFMMHKDARSSAEHLLSALQIYTSTDDYTGTTHTLTNLATLHNLLKQNEFAIRDYQDLLNIYRKLVDRGGEANALNNLGTIYLEERQSSKALACLEQAVQIVREMGRRDLVVTFGTNLGSAYSLFGQVDHALEVYRSALATSRELGDHEKEALLLYFLGQIYFRKRDLEQAADNTRQALEKFPPSEGRNIDNARELLKLIEKEKRRNSPLALAIVLGSLFLFIIAIFTGTTIRDSIRRASFQKTAAAETAFPTEGTITGKVVDKNGNPLVDFSRGQLGYVVLFCTDPSTTGIECLRDNNEDTATSDLSKSLCEITNWDSGCLVHIGLGVQEIKNDGSYTFHNVPPGQYQLLIILYDSGVAAIIHTKNIDLVVAGQTTRYDFVTK